MTIKLEAGKSYRTASGLNTGPMRLYRAGRLGLPALFDVPHRTPRIGSMLWTEDGLAAWGSNSAHAIVAEWEAPDLADLAQPVERKPGAVAYIDLPRVPVTRLFRLRVIIAASLASLGERIAPKPISRVMRVVRQAATGVTAEMESGREGGVLIAGWSVTESGRSLSKAQERSCLAMATTIRTIRERFAAAKV